MFSGDAGPASQHAEELTAPPEGMYWAQVEGLWALRPIVDLERSVDLSGYRPRALSGRPARSTAFPPHLVMSTLANDPHQSTLANDKKSFGLDQNVFFLIFQQVMPAVQIVLGTVFIAVCLFCSVVEVLARGGRKLTFQATMRSTSFHLRRRRHDVGVHL